MEIQSIHPVADLFPMLSDDELNDLAADIKENGLIHPLIVTPDGVLVDGRNRWAACQMLGIDPEVEMFEGDPVAYILSANITRRHLNKGQRTMLTVKATDLFKMKRSEQAALADVSYSHIDRARTVGRWAPELVDGVIAGAIALEQAVRDALNRKAAAESADAKLDLLRQQARDLADEVTEERLTLTEAMGAYKARLDEDERHRKVATRLLSESIVPLAQLRGLAAETAAKYDQELAADGREVTAERLDDALQVLTDLRHLWNGKAGA